MVVNILDEININLKINTKLSIYNFFAIKIIIAMTIMKPTIITSPKDVSPLMISATKFIIFLLKKSIINLIIIILFNYILFNILFIIFFKFSYFSTFKL